MQDPVALLSDRKLGVPCLCLPQSTGYYHLLLSQLHPECRYLLAWREDQSLEMGSVFPLTLSPQRYVVFLTHSPLSTQTKGKLSPSQKALPGAFVIEHRWGSMESRGKKAWCKMAFPWRTPSVSSLLPNNISFNSKTESSFKPLGTKEQGVTTPNMRGEILEGSSITPERAWGTGTLKVWVPFVLDKCDSHSKL